MQTMQWLNHIHQRHMCFLTNYLPYSQRKNLECIPSCTHKPFPDPKPWMPAMRNGQGVARALKLQVTNYGPPATPLRNAHKVSFAGSSSACVTLPPLLHSQALPVGAPSSSMWFLEGQLLWSSTWGEVIFFFHFFHDENIGRLIDGFVFCVGG